MFTLRFCCSVTTMFLSLLLIGCNALSDDECRVTAVVAPTGATANHNLSAPGNQAQFATISSSSGNCPMMPDMIGTWSTSDPVNTAISNESGTAGLATCLNATTSPATITFNGTVHGRSFNTATLNCE